MKFNYGAPWHKESYDKLLNETLPQLLAERLPLTGYQLEPIDDCNFKLIVTVGSDDNVAIAEYLLPQPNPEGLFVVGEHRYVVVPTASTEHLDQAEMLCVGDMLRDYLEKRLGHAPVDIHWDGAMLRTLLPLDSWIDDFLFAPDYAPDDFLEPSARAQRLDTTNWLSGQTHLRRIIVLNRKDVISPGQFGRVCPFETPEGPNIGRVFSIAVGAEISDGKLVSTDSQPESSLGLTASMVPFLEHNDPNRQLMGVNMLRQWLTPPDPEPAIVQTGNEVDAPGFWCGRNLLTAYVFAGPDTYEDAILISESCAKKLDYPKPIEAGDKLSNRHGTKGVVSRIVPDHQMPHLSDGTPVELVFSSIAMHTRLNFGQVREALMSRIALKEGVPAIVTPFHAPDSAEIKNKMAIAGLDPDGMETLVSGINGRQLENRSLVGWVYWGKLAHTVAMALTPISLDGTNGMYQGEREYYALRDVGAFENLMEQFNTRAATRDGIATLVDQLSREPVDQAGAPTPKFAALQKRLIAAGIQAKLSDEKIRFELAEPAEPVVELCEPMPHPWLRDRMLTKIGAVPELNQLNTLPQANDQLARMIQSHVPEALTRKARANLSRCVEDYFKALLGSDNIHYGEALYRTHGPYGDRIAFSGKTVLTPATGLNLDQCGLPDEMSWMLFGPQLAREIGSKEVNARSNRAEELLVELMARSWVLINRAPTIMPTSIIAFHPVRYAERVIRLHPLVCKLMNGDFDGDQAAVFLPITEAAQKEAGEKLSVFGHLKRDPSLIKWLHPSNEALWGLAKLSLTTDGLHEINQIATTSVGTPEGYVTRDSIIDALEIVLARAGVEKAIEAAEGLMRRGFEAAEASGASMSPFIGENLERPTPPGSDEAEAWDRYAQEVSDWLSASNDFHSTDIGPQLLAVKSGARGDLRHLRSLLGPQGSFTDVNGNHIAVKHGYVDGLTAEELFTRVKGAREGLNKIVLDCMRAGYGLRESEPSRAFTVLARAMRSSQPGAVFARAAAIGEIDPLVDLDSRLFVGLPPK